MESGDGVASYPSERGAGRSRDGRGVARIARERPRHQLKGKPNGPCQFLSLKSTLHSSRRDPSMPEPTKPINVEALKSLVRTVPDFPKPGIMFHASLIPEGPKIGR